MTTSPPIYVIPNFEVSLAHLHGDLEGVDRLVVSFDWLRKSGVAVGAWSAQHAQLEIESRGLLLRSRQGGPALLFPLDPHADSAFGRRQMLEYLEEHRSLMICAFNDAGATVLALQFDF